MTSAPAIGFEFRPSRWPGRILALITLLGVLAIWLSGIAWWFKLPLSMGAVLAAWRATVRMAHPLVAAAGWARDGGWSLRMTHSEDAAATLRSFRVAGEQFVWLYFLVQDHGRAGLLLGPDNSDADIRRRLRMRLAQVESAIPDAEPAARGTLSARSGPTV